MDAQERHSADVNLEVGGSSPRNRVFNRGKTALFVFSVALLVRLVYAFLVWSPAFKSPEESMFKMYARSAYFLAAGHGYAQAIPGSPAYFDIEEIRENVAFPTRITAASHDEISADGKYPETLHPPGWSLTAAGLHQATATPVRFNMQVFGALVDALAAVLLYALTLMCFNSRPIALTAATVYAVFPPLAYQAVGLEPLGQMSFFTIASVLFAVKGARADTGVQTGVYLALAGLTIGLGAYFRSDILLLGPFFIVGFIVAERRYMVPFVKVVAILGISVLTLLPWAIRNKYAIDEWAFTSTALGVNLVNGLGEYPNPWQLGGSDVDRNRDARAAGLPHAFHHSADSLFNRMFVEAVREHPLAYVGILARRAVEQPIATPYDWGIKVDTDGAGLASLRAEGRLLSNVKYILSRYWFRLISAAFMFTCLVSSVFLVAREWKRNPATLLILAAPVYFAASHIPLHMEPRYLLPGSFGLIVGFAYAAHALWASARARNAFQRLRTRRSIHVPTRVHIKQ